MANIFTSAPALLDFEEGNLDDIDGVQLKTTGTVEASSTQAKNGTYSCRTYTTDGAVGDRAIAYKSFADTEDVMYALLHLYIDDAGTYYRADGSALWLIWFSRHITYNERCILYLTPSDGKVSLYCEDSGGLQDTSIDFTLSKDTWYEIELKYDRSQTNVLTEVWVNGVSQGSWEGSGQSAADPVRHLSWGPNAYDHQDADNWADVYGDDVRCEDARIGGEAGGVTHEAVAAFAGAGALAGQPLRRIFALGAIPGQGGLTAAGLRQTLGAVSLQGQGALTAIAIRRILATGALQGQSTLTATGLRWILAASALQGQGALTAAGLKQMLAISTLQGQGSLAASGFRLALGFATLAGTGELVAVAAVPGQLHEAVAALVGAGVLSAAGLRQAFGATVLEGQGTLTASGLRAVLPSATLAGLGALTSVPLLTIAGGAVLAGLGILSVVGTTITGAVIVELTLPSRSFLLTLPTRSFGLSLPERDLDLILEDRDG